MKTLRLLCLLLIPAFAAAQSWTLYYSDTETVDGGGNLQVTAPTVGISGDDGGYCNAFEGFTGYETPAVMLNGNAWAAGPTITSGGQYEGGQPLNFAYTFPDVQIAPGQSADLSFAAKVQGLCYFNYGSMPSDFLGQFYIGQFVDGFAPGTDPAPCWIAGNLTPACQMPWPELWANVPRHGIPADLDSQQVAQSHRRLAPCDYGHLP